MASFRGNRFFLSNFYISPFIYKDISFNCSEQAYAWEKVAKEEDKIAILKLNKPGDMKRAGRYMQIRKDWNSIKLDVMRSILYAKFSSNSVNAKLLLNTGDEQLVEVNEWGDRFWGVCNGTGENWLGRLLMEVRTSLNGD